MHPSAENDSNLAAFAAEFGDHRWSAAELQPETITRLGEITPEQWESIFTALESTEPTYAVDWQDLPPAADLPARLQTMARVKTIVPVDNIEIQKDMHNQTLENHIKLLLEAAGTQDSLRIFLELGKSRLSQFAEESPELANQALQVWAPAAEVMGWYGLKEKLERAAFETLFPGELTRITETYVELGGDEKLDAAIERYRDAIREQIAESLPDVAGQVGVDIRRKSYYSVWRKCTLRGQADYRLPDFIGARVVVNSGPGEDWAIEQCYAAASEIGQLYEPEPDRFKDYIAKPKPNGYQSFHMTVHEPSGERLEVQVRTSDMHERAEGDPDISHMVYEASSKLTPGKYFHQSYATRTQRKYRWRQRAAVQARERPQAELSELRPTEVLVFAPDGNLYNLPENATALDCSFRIHSRRALRTTWIKVNGKPARFDGPLQTGDLVAIECALKRPDRDGTWTEDWLQSVTTPRARKAIHRAIKARNADQYVERARKEIAAHFPGEDDPLGLLTEGDYRRISKHYGPLNFETILREIGAGAASSGSVVHWIDQRIKRRAGNG